MSKKYRKGTLAQEMLAEDSMNAFSRKKFLAHSKEREWKGERKKTLKLRMLRKKAERRHKK